MENKKKIILITLIALLFVVAVTLLILNQTGAINRIIENSRKEEIKKEISYEVYKHVDGKTAMLIIAEDTENGIEKIIYPNNEIELYCNGKTKVAFDYNTDITGKESITFKAINTKGEEIEKTVAINDEFYNGLIDYDLIKETESQRVLTVNYKEGSSVKQYRIGENSAWVNYGGGVRMDDYQILETLGNETIEANLEIRQIDNAGNEIIVPIKYKITDSTTYKQEDTVIEGESILACVENNDLESGNYIFRVIGKIEEQNAQGVSETKTETIDYPVELYNYNEDANYITNSIASTSGIWYTGFGHINSEKRMLILKYNGDLTINSGVTITPTGTNQSINGATYLCTKKGMFIYCAGTLTNNGEITMTAKGTVNQAGENVYLYKNANNTYEYVPAVGGIGGMGVTSYGNLQEYNGENGQDGLKRRTGGGASGASAGSDSNGTSGRGSNGTSYSGGTGGGGCGRYNASNGSPNGGTGGNARNGWGGSRDGSGGGAGNPGGAGASGYVGGTGTGGFLMIYTNAINNNGTISSNGSNGGYGNDGGGGGSGGGSINIFYKANITRGTINSSGGLGGGRCIGGNGGTGSITIGNISTGTFVKDE